MNLAILGATGSIGASTLDVARAHPGRYRVFALSAHGSADALLELCRVHRPRFAVLSGVAEDRAARARFGELGVEVLFGSGALEEVVAHPECHAVMAAIVGAAGLRSTLAAAAAGKRVLLANKEALVMAGPLVMRAARESGAKLLPVDSDRSILELALDNLRAVDVTDITVVTGHRAEAITQRVPTLERRYGVRLTPVFNPRYAEWNNAYSLWLARDAFRDGALLVNGDTVHPASVEESLLAARGPDVLLAVDREKRLGDEEMKVVLSEAGSLRRIGKDVDPATAHGEYIGLALIEPAAAGPLAEALEATWRRDPSLYYEDGWQELVDRGGQVHVAPNGAVDWVEVDDHSDLARARELECRY
jgi:choline kinase